MRMHGVMVARENVQRTERLAMTGMRRDHAASALDSAPESERQ